jgi:DNA-binding NtrC family response regulator
LSLPGADGFAVVQAARLANPASYVVIVTGYASLDSAIRAVRSGAYDYLTKPFSLSQLEVILDRIRDRVRLEETGRRLQPTPPVDDYPERPSPVGSLEHRLAAIERSLARIERVLVGRTRPAT